MHADPCNLRGRIKPHDKMAFITASCHFPKTPTATAGNTFFSDLGEPLVGKVLDQGAEEAMATTFLNNHWGGAWEVLPRIQNMEAHKGALRELYGFHAALGGLISQSVQLSES